MDHWLSQVEPADLIRYGLIPEFIGRLPVIATLEELDEEALIKILTEPKNALVKQYTRLFAMENVSVEFRPDALIAIAKKSSERKAGARGLRSILEHALLDTMFDLPSQTDLDKVVIDANVIEKKSAPLLVYKTNKTKQTLKSALKG